MATTILLQAGTNEVEIVEFCLADASYGVNAAKIKQILPYDAAGVTHLTHRHQAVLGVFLLRGEVHTLIDLSIALGNGANPNPPVRRVIVVTEFNGTVVGFLVDGVRRIHRTSWEAFRPLPEVVGHRSQTIVGVVSIDEHECLIVDFESIMTEFDPSLIMRLRSTGGEGQEADRIKRRERVIVVAEDSPMIRKQIVSVLHESGYEHIHAFETGARALAKVRELHDVAAAQGQAMQDVLTAIVSDIEMPEMDGLTFCRQVKQELKVTTVPVIMFSSLITKQMAVKCRSVGANSAISKPRINTLVQLLDDLIESPNGPQDWLEPAELKEGQLSVHP
jgi:two-component system chemotaxis response regulator CheV